MPGGERPDESAEPEAQDESNIRWLLAAVLHHQPDDDPDLDDSDG